MTPQLTRALGLLLALVYAGCIVWLYSQQPRTVVEVRTGLAVTVGAYRVDPANFEQGLRLFHEDQWEAARAAFERADPAARDPETQFYIAYSYYREGWGRLYTDRTLYRAGLDAVDRAVAAAPGGRVVVEDPGLEMHTADELRVELQRGLRLEASDFNPLRLFRRRQ